MPSTPESITEFRIARQHHPFRSIGVLGEVAAGFEARNRATAEHELQYLLHARRLRRTQVLPDQPSPRNAAPLEALRSPSAPTRTTARPG
jgi:hypothetical protein